jgi:hypothetical protein
MPTIDPSKNVEYVKRSQAKKKEAVGKDTYNRINADAEQRHRDKVKTKIGEDEYKRQQAAYMKAYREKQRQSKKDVGTKQNQKAVNTLTDAIKARKAKKELLALAIESANKTANKFSEIDKTSHLSQVATVGSNLSEIGEKLLQPRRSKRGRPAKSQ